MTAAANHEQRMLVDGKLVESATGKTFDNVNPATEEVLGPVADGSSADMHRAIDGARRAFDETDWSTNRELRNALPLPAAGRPSKERAGGAAREAGPRGGLPADHHDAYQLDIPLDAALRYPIKLIDEFPWRTDLKVRSSTAGARPTRERSGRSPSASSVPLCPGTSRSR